MSAGLTINKDDLVPALRIGNVAFSHFSSFSYRAENWQRSGPSGHAMGTPV
jgi:hypothetical protein